MWNGRIAGRPALIGRGLGRTAWVVAAVGLAAGLYWYYAPRCVQGDCRNGCGVHEQRNAFRYEGCFRESAAHGRGTFRAATGHVYSGEWQRGEKHGRGTYHYPDGSVYEGEWAANVRQGFGVQRDAQGKEKFRGQWHADQPVLAGEDPLRPASR